MRLPALLLLPVLGLAGCHSIADVAGIASAASVGSASANPAVGIAVGIGVRAGVDELVKYVQRKRWGGEQDAIADAAGTAPLGEARPWEIRHTIPIGNERGQLEAVREFSTPLATCREIVFSVQDDPPEHYTTTLCRGAERWNWAAAEPAVDRWGFLQHQGF